MRVHAGWIALGLLIVLATAVFLRTDRLGWGLPGYHIPDESIRDQFQATWSERTPLAPDDVARAILFAVSQPWHVNVNEILIRPTEQET